MTLSLHLEFNIKLGVSGQVLRDEVNLTKSPKNCALVC